MDLSLKDKIHGCIFGYAIGDALGLGTEFMTKAEVRMRYPDGLTDYSQIIRDAHRSSYRQGEWTLDTEVLLIISEEIIRSGNLDPVESARALQKWYKRQDHVDLASCMRWVFNDERYADDPIGAAHMAWKKIGLFEASNEALGRSLIAGIWNTDPVTDAIGLTSITHADTRCTSAAAVIALVTRDLLHHDRDTDFAQLEQIVHEIDERTLPYLQTARSGKIEDLDLDDEDTIWYVRKAMASSLWALWHCDSPEEILHSVIHEGGDADTNGSLAMALAGIKYGFDALPHNLIDGLLCKERLYRIAESYCNILSTRS